MVEFDLLRRTTESQTQMRGAFPEASASALCVQGAALSRSEKSRALESAQENLGLMAAAGQMRRQFGPCGGDARQDVLVAADVDVSSDDDADFGAWEAHRKAKKRSEKEKKEEGEVRKKKKGVRSDT